MRSLPNVIKSKHVMINDANIKIINSNKDEFTPMVFKQAVEIPPEVEEDSTEDVLYQMNHEENASEQLSKMQSFASSLIEDAKKEAEDMKLAAMKAAQDEISMQKEEAVKCGYSEGLANAEVEISRQKQQLKEKELQLEKVYNAKVVEMQSQLSDLLLALVQKITGVIIEEKSIITYLICDSIKGQTTCNEFRISVSKADFEEVNEHKSEIEELLRSTAQVTIIENPELVQNQCKIETEKNIIDCGIETKLNNLSMALKLLT